MSAGVHAYVQCDFWDRSKPASGGMCRERIEEGFTLAEARHAARAAGWLTAVHADGSAVASRRLNPSRTLFDFCPDHKPAPEATP
jgi:hypothetical protein